MIHMNGREITQTHAQKKRKAAIYPAINNNQIGGFTGMDAIP